MQQQELAANIRFCHAIIQLFKCLENSEFFSHLLLTELHYSHAILALYCANARKVKNLVFVGFVYVLIPRTS